MVQGFGYVVSRFEVFKVRGFATCFGYRVSQFGISGTCFSRFGVSGMGLGFYFSDSGFLQVRGFGDGVHGYGVSRLGVSGTRFRFREVRRFEVWGFGYVVLRFEVFKVRGFAYGVSGTWCRWSAFRVGGIEVRGFRYEVSRTRFWRFRVSVMGFSRFGY